MSPNTAPNQRLATIPVPPDLMAPQILGSYVQNIEHQKGKPDLNPGGHGCCCESVCGCYPVS